MPYRYAYIRVKRTGKVHEIDSDGRTYCQAENSTRRLAYTNEFPPNRIKCFACAGVKRERQYAETHGKLDAEFKAIMET